MPGQSNYRISRKKYLEILSSKRNVLLIGPYKIGKTLLLKQFLEKNKNAVYIDFSRISINPENFAVEFTCKAAKEKNFDALYEKRNSFKGELIEKIHNELQKIKPDQRLLIEWAFSFANSLGKIELLIDNFEEFLWLNNYGQIKDIMSLFFSFKLPNMHFILTSDSDLEKIFSGHNFLVEKIKNFDKKEAKELVVKIVGKVSDRVVNEIFELSHGHPHYICSICSKYKKIKDVKRAYSEELFSENGLMYNACKFEFFSSLNKARGKTLLKTILKVLSENNELRLNEISKKIYRSSPVTQSLLLRLISVGLVSSKKGRYSFANLVLKEWARHYFSEDR